MCVCVWVYSCVYTCMWGMLICVWGCTHVCVYMYVSVCLSMCVLKPEAGDRCLPSTPTFWDRVSVWTWGLLFELYWLVSKPVGSTCIHPYLEVLGTHSFHRVLGIQTKFSSLHGEHFPQGPSAGSQSFPDFLENSKCQRLHQICICLLSMLMIMGTNN